MFSSTYRFAAQIVLIVQRQPSEKMSCPQGETSTKTGAFAQNCSKGSRGEWADHTVLLCNIKTRLSHADV